MVVAVEEEEVVASVAVGAVLAGAAASPGAANGWSETRWRIHRSPLGGSSS